MFGKYFKMEQVKYVLALSCIIPAAIGLFNLKKVEDKYLPFIFMMVLDVIIELISNFTRDHKLVNVYMLVDFSLFLYFVYNNKFLNKNLAKLFIENNQRSLPIRDEFMAGRAVRIAIENLLGNVQRLDRIVAQSQLPLGNQRRRTRAAKNLLEESATRPGFFKLSGA